MLREKGCGWGGRIRTSAWRYQKPLPYRLATPHQDQRLCHYPQQVFRLGDGSTSTLKSGIGLQHNQPVAVLQSPSVRISFTPQKAAKRWGKPAKFGRCEGVLSPPITCLGSTLPWLCAGLAAISCPSMALSS